MFNMTTILSSYVFNKNYQIVNDAMAYLLSYFFTLINEPLSQLQHCLKTFWEKVVFTKLPKN